MTARQYNSSQFVDCVAGGGILYLVRTISGVAAMAMEITQRPKPLDPPLAELVGLQFGLSTKKDIVSQIIPSDYVQNARATSILSDLFTLLKLY